MTTWVEPGQDAKARLAPVAAFNAKLVADQKKRRSPGPMPTSAARRWRATTSPAAGLARGPAAPGAQGRGGGDQRPGGQPLHRPVTLEAAQALRDEFKLGDGEATDVLTISLSATDFIGHRFGTKGPEMCDHLLRLDDRLGVFLDSLDKVKGQVLVVLAADHGGSDFPSAWPSRAMTPAACRRPSG
jgi:predicted AlkP superfamily pyrophosphatase or phosphodiesterase